LWCMLAASGMSPATAVRKPPQAVSGSYLTAQVPPPDPDYRAFLKANCLRCHDATTATAGVRVDNLDEKFGDDTVKKWEAVHHRIAAGTMPPKGAPQPSPQERQAACAAGEAASRQFQVSNRLNKQSAA